MRILLDNNIPYRFKNALAGLDVTHVQDVGLANLLDGPLLSAIDTKFDILVTMDRNLQYQRNLAGRSFSVVVLRATSNRFGDLLPLVAALKRQLPKCRAPECYDVII